MSIISYNIVIFIQVYLGGLRSDCDKGEIMDVFRDFGRVGLFSFMNCFMFNLVLFQVLKVWIAQRPPGFGFVLMSCPGDAEDAVRSLHGTRMCGNR